MAPYPFRGGPAFAADQWYIAAWSVEVGPTPLARTILGEEVALYRRRDGDVAAVAGVCPHRWMPLAGAQVVDDAIVCPYHGARFEASGRCAAVPGGGRVPPNFALKTYAVVERGPCVWIWAGEAHAADPDRLPDVASLGWGVEGWGVELAGPLMLHARSQLLIENLFDQSHIAHVHPATLGACEHDLEPPLVLEDAVVFRVLRRPPPMIADAGVKAVFPDAAEHIQARLRIELHGAGLINSAGSRTYSLDAPGVEPRLLGELNFLHGVTPATETTTHYFASMTRSFALDSAELSQALMERNVAVIREDAYILEAIERNIDRHGDISAETTFGTDLGAMAARRRMEALRRGPAVGLTRAA